MVDDPGNTVHVALGEAENIIATVYGATEHNSVEGVLFYRC